MKLYRLKINWTPFDDTVAYTDTDLWWLSPFVASETVPVWDYDDISSIENWNTYWYKLGKDYKRWRDHLGRVMKDMAVATTLWTESDDTNIVSPNVNDSYLVGQNALNAFIWKEEKIAIWNWTSWDFKEKQEVWFPLCTPTEQLILTEHKFWTHAQRVATVWFTNTVLLWLAYNKKALDVRQIRLSVAHWYVDNYLPDNAKNLFENIKRWNVESVVNRYVFYWIEWSLAWDPLGISDWLYWLWLYAWEGLVDQPRTPEQWLTMQQVADAAWDVIHNGNY